jgi:hypothetical protein
VDAAQQSANQLIAAARNWKEAGDQTGADALDEALRIQRAMELRATTARR